MNIAPLIQHDNDQCVKIWDALYYAFQDIRAQGFSFLNIASIFYFDIAHIISAYVLCRSELVNRDEEKDYISLRKMKSRTYPYVDCFDVLTGIKPNDKIYSFKVQKPGSHIVLLSWVSWVQTLLRNKGDVGICLPIDCDKSIFYSIIKYGYGLKFIQKRKVFIPKRARQEHILFHYLFELFSVLEIPQKNISGINSVIRKHIDAYMSSDDRVNQLNCDALVLGPLSFSSSRIIAAQGRESDIPVITVSHGGGDQLMFDEPRFGVCERSYPTHFLGYGPVGLNIQKDAKYLRILFDQPEYVCTNFTIAKRVFNNNAIIKNEIDLENDVIMYVPDSLQYVNRSGPFGTISENLYIEWQRMLCNVFKKIIYKKHVKGFSKFRNLTEQEVKEMIDPYGKSDIKVLSQNFTECYEQCDAYIFDHISTAFMIAAATDKPIVYFNIGKRNLTSFAEKCVKKRCVWVDINIQDADDVKEKLQHVFNGGLYVDQITPNFSIDEANLNLKREDRLLQVLRSVLS